MNDDHGRESSTITRRTALGLLGAAATLPLVAPGRIALFADTCAEYRYLLMWN
jgi:hypothetical protein